MIGAFTNDTGSCTTPRSTPFTTARVSTRVSASPIRAEVLRLHRSHRAVGEAGEQRAQALGEREERADGLGDLRRRPRR